MSVVRLQLFWPAISLSIPAVCMVLAVTRRRPVVFRGLRGGRHSLLA